MAVIREPFVLVIRLRAARRENHERQKVNAPADSFGGAFFRQAWVEDSRRGSQSMAHFSGSIKRSRFTWLKFLHRNTFVTHADADRTRRIRLDALRRQSQTVAASRKHFMRETQGSCPTRICDRCRRTLETDRILRKANAIAATRRQQPPIPFLFISVSRFNAIVLLELHPALPETIS